MKMLAGKIKKYYEHEIIKYSNHQESASQNRSNRTWTVEEQPPVFKSPRRTDELAMIENFLCFLENQKM